MIHPSIHSYSINTFAWTVVVGNIWLGLVIGLVTHWSRDD